MSDDSKIKIFRPFGPSVAKIKLPNEMIGILNSHIDKIIENEKLKRYLLSRGYELELILKLIID